MSAMWALWAFKTDLLLRVFHVFLVLPSPQFTQKLRRRECDWRLLSSVDQNAKPGPVIQLASYTRSSSNDPGIIENSGIKPGSWWPWCSKSDQYCLGWQTWASRVCQEQCSCHWPWRSPTHRVPVLLSVVHKYPTSCRSQWTHLCNPQCPQEHWINSAALSDVSPPKGFQKNWWESS